MFGEKVEILDKTMGDHELHDQLWEQSQANQILESLKDGEKLQDILKRTPGFKESFLTELDTLDCADGRVCSGHKMGLAGSGILLSPEEKEILKAEAKKRGLKITGHDNCGAAALAYPGSDSDKFGYENARTLASETGLEYGEVHEQDFRVSVHNERMLVIEETGRFDCANWAEFPGQFISSAPALGLPDDYLQKEIVALTNIALGNHSFGGRFTSEDPFYIVISASSAEKLAHLEEVATEAVQVFKDRVRVSGFIAPEKKE